jgi:integrase
LDAAKTYAEVLARKTKEDGASVFALDARQRADAVAALAALKGKATLEQAARFWAKHNLFEGADAPTVDGLAARWFKALHVRGCRDTTLREREHKMTRLAAALDNRPVQSITKAEILAVLESWGVTGATWDGYRRAYRAAFQFATEEGILEANPLAGVRKVTMDERMPQPFTVPVTQAVLRTAAEHAPIMVPTLAVQFFAGLRPGEALGLDWSAVDFAGKQIRVMPETSKVRRSRIVELSDTLRDWLWPYRKASGPIGITKNTAFQYNMHRKPMAGKRGIIAAAGVKWIQDGPRKSFASAHYAVHQDAAKLAATLGHTGGQDVLFRHYRGLMSKQDGERYFGIRPVSRPLELKRLA